MVKIERNKNFSFIFSKKDGLDAFSITALFIVVIVWEIRRKPPSVLLFHIN